MTLPENPEPSVLDYLKSKIFPGKHPVISIQTESPQEQISQESIKTKKPRPIAPGNSRTFWLIIVILISVMSGQKLLEPPNPSILLGLFFYGCGLALFLILWFRGRFETNLYLYEDEEPGVERFHPVFLVLSVVTGFAAAVFFTRNRFTPINVSLWIFAILFLLAAFTRINPWQTICGVINYIQTGKIRESVSFRVTPWILLVALSFSLVLFFRFFRLNQVPIEMISDHAEKLLDVNDVLGGKFPIFFVRNTGREAFQMYLSAAVALIFGTGISFLTLKIGTAIMGVFTAIYVFLLGKETGNRWVGLFAFLLCGIGYWPNVISRVGLRFTLYPAFTAPALYYFFRGIRKKNLFYLVLAGVFTGIGLQGYSPYRVVPILLVFGFILYMIHFSRKAKLNFAYNGLIVLSLASLILFLPLLRFMLDQPELFTYRALTRISSIERPLPGPAWQLLLSNLWAAVTMPFYRDGTIWVHSVANRPALDVMSASIFFLGIVTGIIRYFQQKDWRVLFLFLSIPILMIPSIISIAFPAENPCLNRTAGALVPIFIIAGMGLDTFLYNIKRQLGGLTGSLISSLVSLILMTISVFQNYGLVFNQYKNTYINSSWNSSQMGAVIRDFVNIFGDPNSAYVVGYPYWVDTRLVGMNAGYPTKDYAIWPKDFAKTLTNPRAKLFIMYQNDTQSLDALRSMYPEYYEYLYRGWTMPKDFIVFIVPPSINSNQEVTTPVPSHEK